jgi:hypothetical protein
MGIRWMAVAGLALLASGSTTRASEPIDLKVLYAGELKNDRTADFHSFLKLHFSKVGLADYLTLSQANTQGYDVVILDWPGLPPRDDDGQFKHPTLDSKYDRPTILIGGGTLGVGRHLGLKLDNLCICLGEAAHDVQTSHEIFHTPYEARLDSEDRPTPPGYRSWPEGEHLGKTIKVWKVQKRGWSIDDPNNPAIMSGMVSDPYGFTDSPDTEFIASGINMKSPVAVAIGRQGNFLLWGFYAQPSDLTAEARKWFINAVCYIKKFDGQVPLVRKARGQLARQWALVLAFACKAVSDRDSFIKSQPESLRGNPETLAALHQSRVEQLRTEFPDELRRQLGDDPERYIKHFGDNLEYLRPSGKPGISFVIDEEVKGLGLSNRKVELLDKCVSMLAQGDRSDLALRILKRYTTEDFATAEGWRTWLEAQRDRLFFTDVGGFKFMAAPKSPARADRSTVDLPEPDAEHPVVASADLSPGKLKAGGTLDLIVRVRMAPTWHIYAAVGSKGPGIPTTLSLRLPEGIEAEGDWTYPEAHRGSDGQMIHEGAVEFRRKLRVGRAARGTIRVSCEFGYQACDPHSCQLPTKETLRGTAEVEGASGGN